MKYEKETKFCFFLSKYVLRAHVHVYNMLLFFRNYCLIHGRELLSNVGTVSYLTTLFLPGKTEAYRRQFDSI